MLLHSYYDEDTGIRITESIEYDEEKIKKSKEEFKKLKDKEIIISGNFEDAEWIVTNEVYRNALNFEFDEILYNKESKKKKYVHLQTIYKQRKILRSVKYIQKINTNYKRLFTRA